jgi:hypothetical protein
MKKYKKAALLSAFLFPGAGHLFFKKYISGGIISGISAIALYVLISHAITRALDVSQKILHGEIAADIQTIMTEVSSQVSEADALTLDTATAVFVIMWIISIVDAYRIGR